MDQHKTVLLIAFTEENCHLLSSILAEDGFECRPVQNDEALHALQAQPADISLIIMDAKAALVNDGDYLKALRASRGEEMQPIFVSVQETSASDGEKCLALGASFVLSQPFVPSVVRKAVRDQLRMRRLSYLLYRVGTDPLTGVFKRELFMDHVARRLRSDSENAYDMVCLELESYQLLFGRYGVEKCNSFMKTTVDSLAACLPDDVIMGRIDDSQIALLMRHIPFEFHKMFMDKCVEMAKTSPYPNIVFNAGVYSNIDHQLPPEIICELALLPIDNVRYQPEAFIAEYDDTIRKNVFRQKQLTDCMYIALREKQFKLYYQPKYGIDGHTICGAEALVRWQHPEMGLLCPADFIPLFEKNGFIYELDKFVLEAACADLKRWLDAGLHPVPMSVNVSQTDFDQYDLNQVFVSIVDKYAIPHELIHFEITESAQAPDALKTLSVIQTFRRQGFQIELDDFGAGYSTLSVLAQLPIDVMKVDMSLIRNMFDSKYNAILKGALFTAAGLDIKVIAEGVETPEQVEALRAMGKGTSQMEVQGFYFSHPLPVNDFEAILSST